MGNRNKNIKELFEQKDLLESKIKMTKQIIADLEKLKQDEFNFCFVDLNPYKDESFVQSELGMIPEGWKVGTFTDLLKVYKQKTENINLDKVLETSYQFSHYVYYAWKSKYDQGITNGFENEPVLIPAEADLNFYEEQAGVWQSIKLKKEAELSELLKKRKKLLLMLELLGKATPE
nr:hypothetical protein [Prevotella sp.]